MHAAHEAAAENSSGSVLGFWSRGSRDNAVVQRAGRAAAATRGGVTVLCVCYSHDTICKRALGQSMHPSVTP